MHAAQRRAAFRFLVHALLPLAVGCGGARDAGGAQPKPAATAAGPSTAARTPDGAPMRWAGKLVAGKAIEVRTVSGSVHARAATGDTAEIEARMTGASGDGAPRVVFTEDPHGILAKVEMPHHEGCDCDCDGDHDHDRDHERGPGAIVDFDVRVPAGVRLIAHSVRGTIQVDDVTGPVEARTVEGAIQLKAATSARARTVNGSITASFKAPDLDSDTELDTVNGLVQVTLPSNANADLSATTLNGDIRIGFPLLGSMEPRRAHVTIGHGGHELRLRTVNGSIEVAKGA